MAEGRLYAGTQIKVQFTFYENGTLLNLTGATGLSGRFIKPSGAVLDKALSVVGSPTLGVAECTLNATTEFAAAEFGPWQLQATGTKSDGAPIAAYTPELFANKKL